MYRIDFPRGLFDELRSHLLGGPNGREEAAYVLCGVSQRPGLTRLLPREILKVPDDVSSKGWGHVTVDPEFVAEAVKRARLAKSTVLLTHSHPFSTRVVGFSGIDDHGEEELMPRLWQRVPGVPHGAVVFGQDSLRARVYPPGSDQSQHTKVRVVGERTNEPGDQPSEDIADEELFSRQLSAIGPRAQGWLGHLRVGVVGLGGTGSHILQQLLLVGLRHFALVDKDVVDRTNLNRLVGATPADIGRPKTEVGLRQVTTFRGEAEAVHGDVETMEVVSALLDCDVVLGCTDNMASRRVLDRLVHQYYIPVIDVGIELVRGPDGEFQSGIVRAILLVPSDPCLECQGFLRDDGPAAANYGQGGREPAVSVVHWNALAAALGMELFLGAFTEMPSRRPPGTFLQYRILDGVLKPAKIERVSGCTLCAEVKGLGDAIDLPVYRKATSEPTPVLPRERKA